MRHVSLSCAIVFTLLSGSAVAQPAAGAPDAAAVQAARDVVMKMQGDRSAMLATMSTPMVGLIQQMGVTQPDQARVLVTEVVVPTLATHLDDFLDIQARAYASVLSADDLKAVSKFYDTPAGHDLVAAQPRLAQAQVTGMTQWLSGLAPDLRAKLAEAIARHGWGPGGKAKSK